MLHCATLAACVLAALPSTPTQEELERHEFRRTVMGTEARIVLWAPSGDEAREAAAAAFARMLEIDALASDWNDASELSLLGARSGGEPMHVSAELFDVLALAREVAEQTDGRFDPTVAPLTHLWRAHRGSDTFPTPGAITAAREIVGWVDLELDVKARTVRLARVGMGLDLGGVAKGFACDEALAALRDSDLERALVEIGGDIAVGTPPPGRDGWRVAVACGGEITGNQLVLANEGVANSGDTYQFLEHEGRRYSHVLDPRTGFGLEASTCTTVVAPSCALADALASAVHVAGSDAGRLLLERGFPAARIVGDDDGFEDLFDGETLTGWTTDGGRYDGNAAWTVEDGCIVGRTGPEGTGGLLYTEQPHTSFELELETRIDYPFDSGIFVRMVPPGGGRGVQVTLDDRPGGEIAGVYSDGWLQHNPDGRKAWKQDQWNHVRVRCTGFDMRLEVWINGEPTLDWTAQPNAEGFAPSGLIGIQVHDAESGGRNAVRFRNLRVRDLPVFGKRDGHWRPLLHEDLSGWEVAGSEEGYALDGNVLAVSAASEGGYLRTREDFRDFRLHVEFKTSELANSGVFLRAAPNGSPAYSGCEVQILDDWNWEEATGTTLEPWQKCGSLYDAVPAGTPSPLRPIGEWNTYEMLYRGSRLAVALNRHTLYDVDTHALEVEPPFAERASTGAIGLQRHTSPAGDATVWFRNVFVQPLD